MMTLEEKAQLDDMLNMVYSIEFRDRMEPKNRGLLIHIYVGAKQYMLLQKGATVRIERTKKEGITLRGWPVISVQKENYFAVHLGGRIYGE